MIIVFDLGGTNTKVATIATVQKPVLTPVASFPTAQVYEEQLARLAQVIGPMRAKADGIGLAIGAQLTADGQSIDASYTMPNYEGKPLVPDISKAVNLPAKSANDNVCGVLAESYLGCLKTYQRAAYLTISTGTGTGIRLGQGNKAIAFLGQVGHHMINPQGAKCNCGQVGCVQTITGGQQLLERFGKPAAQITDEAAWQEVTEAIAIAIVNLARITRIEAVCVGGGIGYNNAYIRTHLAEMTKAKGPGLTVEVLVPTFKEQAPLIGAGVLFSDQMQTTIIH